MPLERTITRWILATSLSVALIGCTRIPPVTSPMGARGLGSPAAEVPRTPTRGVINTEEPPRGQALSSTVTKVTVYSDRAQVTREAKTTVSTTPTTFTFRKLPGWVDDASVRVAASAGRIIDVRVERSFLARATDKTWQKAKARHRTLTKQLAALDDEIKILEAQKRQIEGIKAFSLAKINKTAITGGFKVRSYGEVLTFISSSLRTTAKARRAVSDQREALLPEIRASKRRLTELKGLMKLEETTVFVTLQNRRARPCTIGLTYMIPGATWQPMHELRVNTSDSQRAEVISFAVVTQTSGEDWRKAQISFSTQSSTQSVRIPELEALTLGETHTATRILTSKMTSFRRAEKAFLRQGQLWNKAHLRASRQARSNFNQVYQRNIKYLQVVQSKTVRIFQSLQKRGTTAHFRAITAPTVRGDGHPVRMRIGRSVLASRQKIVAVPEQSLNAARTLQMTNATTQPFLPGKVALYQDGAFLGLTDIAFIAEGETFSLFLSVADHLKLSRKMDRKRSSLVRRRRNKMQVAFVVTVENLSSKETEVALADRIPVSENKEIRIDHVRITGRAKPNSRGLLRWKLKLKPKEKRQFRIAYRIEYPAELVLETRRRRNRARMRRHRSRSQAPAAQNAARPVKRRKYKIADQLVDLEAAL